MYNNLKNINNKMGKTNNKLKKKLVLFQLHPKESKFIVWNYQEVLLGLYKSNTFFYISDNKIY